MLKPHRELVGYLVLGLLAGLLPFGYVVASYMEASAYNRVTGKHVSTWDAMWVDLRVTGEARE
jgi:hypothetical protein